MNAGMYSIYENVDRTWTCLCNIQDGTEKWIEGTKERAVQTLIQAARTFNGSYIREDDIAITIFTEELKPSSNVSKEDLELLASIRQGEKVILDHNDPRIKYRITPRECEKIIAIREGRDY